MWQRVDLCYEILGFDTTTLIEIIARCEVATAYRFVSCNHRFYRYCKDTPEVLQALRNAQLRKETTADVAFRSWKEKPPPEWMDALRSKESPPPLVICAKGGALFSSPGFTDRTRRAMMPS